MERRDMEWRETGAGGWMGGPAVVQSVGSKAKKRRSPEGRYLLVHGANAVHARYPPGPARRFLFSLPLFLSIFIFSPSSPLGLRTHQIMSGQFSEPSRGWGG
ncbi:hypothetical protein V2G26_000304 [Clonostachys chloroleuca]